MAHREWYEADKFVNGRCVMNITGGRREEPQGPLLHCCSLAVLDLGASKDLSDTPCLFWKGTEPAKCCNFAR